MEIIAKNSFPMCFMGGNRFLLYHCGSIIEYDALSMKKLRKYRVDRSFREKILGGIPWLLRFFRLGVQCAIPINDSTVCFSLKKGIFEYNLEEERLDGPSNIVNGIKPLVFTQIRNIPGFDDMIAFGGYMGNPLKHRVDIYGRKSVNKWEILYTFDEGKINHVHALIPDLINECVWIFTGDFGDAAGIWQAKNNFKEVTPILIGEQMYRGCVGFPVEGGLLYATDSHLERNSIRIMKKTTDGWKSEKLLDTSGSCIQGCQAGKYYFFDSCVEGLGEFKNLLHFIFSKKRGPGILDSKVRIYGGNLQEGFKEIYAQEKDNMPISSFQFGMYDFASGENSHDYILFRQMSTRKNCLSTIKLLIK